MTDPRGFTRCDECEGSGEIGPIPADDWHRWLYDSCPSCSGSGLVPTEKLREDVVQAVIDAPGGWGMDHLADAVLRKVAEHIGEGHLARCGDSEAPGAARDRMKERGEL